MIKKSKKEQSHSKERYHSSFEAQENGDYTRRHFLIAVTSVQELSNPIPMETRSMCAMEIPGNRVLVSGGKDGYVGTKGVYIYGFENNLWSRGPDLRVQRYGHGCVTMENKYGAMLGVFCGGKSTHSGEGLEQVTESSKIAQERAPGS